MTAPLQQLHSSQGVHLGGAQCTLLWARGVLCLVLQLQAVPCTLRQRSKLRPWFWTFGGEATSSLALVVLPRVHALLL